MHRWQAPSVTGAHQGEEQRHVVVHKLWQVHVAQRPHEHQLLRHARRATLESAGHDQHALEGAEAEVVVVLLGQLLGGQLVQDRHLFGEDLGMTREGQRGAWQRGERRHGLGAMRAGGSGRVQARRCQHKVRA